MPVLLIEKKIGSQWSVKEYKTWPEMMSAMQLKASSYPAALLRKAQKGELIIFEGKRRAAEGIVRGLIDDD